MQARSYTGQQNLGRWRSQFRSTGWKTGCQLRPNLESGAGLILWMKCTGLIDAMDRLVAKPEFKGKIYLQYERQESGQRPTIRAFGRANSGLVFQETQALDLNSVPMLHLFYADKSFSGAHGSDHRMMAQNIRSMVHKLHI